MQNHTWSFVQSGNSNQNPSLTSDLLIRPGNLRSGRGISVRIGCLTNRRVNRFVALYKGESLSLRHGIGQVSKRLHSL